MAAAAKKAGRPPDPVEDAPVKRNLNASDYNLTKEELVIALADPMWRLNNLYKVVNEKTEVVTFRIRPCQKILYAGLHTRNVILKARKIGFSTAIQLLMLDTAMFSPNVRGVVIAQDLDKAQTIFRDTIKFAYDNLPEELKCVITLESTPSKSLITFTNPEGNSLIEVRVSARGTTPTFLHVSEFGKIAAKDPGAAEEIITGSIAAVAEDGLIFVESTAEGQAGAFYDMVTTARDLQESGKELWKLDFKFFFFGWWQDPKYVAPPHVALITAEDIDYFDDLQQQIGIILGDEQKAWYVKFKKATMFGNQELMWREMPSTPDEAFKVSLEGAYFKDQFRELRRSQRIGYCPYDDMHPVSTFWDIGQNDKTAIWLIQPRRTYYAVIGYLEESGEPYSYFVKRLDALGYTFDYHYLPHDAQHRRQGANANLTPEEMLLSVAPYYRVRPVDKTPDKLIPIQQARILLGQCVFDEKNCAVGLNHLEMYRKEWNPRTGTWRDTPRHDISSNAADAFMQAAQAKALGIFSSIGNYQSANGTAFGVEYGDDVVLGF